MIPGCHITIQTSAKTDKEARLLLMSMGLPFYGELVDQRDAYPEQGQVMASSTARPRISNSTQIKLDGISLSSAFQPGQQNNKRDRHTLAWFHT